MFTLLLWSELNNITGRSLAGERELEREREEEREEEREIEREEERE